MFSVRLFTGGGGGVPVWCQVQCQVQFSGPGGTLVPGPGGTQVPGPGGGGTLVQGLQGVP